MAGGVVRRPLPALVALLALALLTALVWWRVIHRDDKKHSHATASCSSTASPVPTTTPTSPATSSLPAPHTITVAVLNGTYTLKKSRPGIAGKARSALAADGFHVTAAAGNDTKVKVRSVAEIRYGPRGADAAKLLAYYFPNAVPKPQDWKTTTVTVSVGAKYTQVATKATVARELAADHVRVPGVTATTPSSSPTC